MFHDIPEEMLDRMRALEDADAVDRQDGTPQSHRLRQIPPVTGRFLALMAAGSPGGKIVEVGTSAGYSTMWLSLACSENDRHITTIELLDNKVELAHETFRLAGIKDKVTLLQGDARTLLAEFGDIAFCFLDADKDVYQACYDPIVSNMVSGGVLLADNVVSHSRDLQPFVEGAVNDRRVDSVVVPIGKGLLFCRKI
jgi:predicted O-methyltransferase YrrM